MARKTSADIRDHLSRLALGNAFEIEELRRTPIDVKLRQLWSLMTAAHLFEDAAEREAQVHTVRERWARLHQAFRG